MCTAVVVATLLQQLVVTYSSNMQQYQCTVHLASHDTIGVVVAAAVVVAGTSAY
jgi:hypothetical protein